MALNFVKRFSAIWFLRIKLRAKLRFASLKGLTSCRFALKRKQPINLRPPDLISWVFIIKMAERVGFEPTVPCDITGFQDRLLKPLGHLSAI